MMSELYHALEAYKDYASRKPRTVRLNEFVKLARKDVLVQLENTRKRIRSEISNKDTQDLFISAFENQVDAVFAKYK